MYFIDIKKKSILVYEANINMVLLSNKDNKNNFTA